MEQESSSRQTLGQLSCTQQHNPFKSAYTPGKPDLNRQSRRKMSCTARHEQQIPGSVFSPGLCEAFSCVYISIHSSLKNGTAKETLLARHQQA